MGTIGTDRAERRASDYLADRMTAIEGRMDDMPAAFEAAFRRVLSDDEVLKKFWMRGYTELSSHASNGASQWVGKRILTAIIVALTTAGIVWLAKTGQLK
jgi:hypothetical protein